VTTPAASGPLGETGTTLAELAVGGSGRVQTVGGEPEFRQRLLELGIVPGVRVRVTRTAPLGDPIEIEVRGSEFSLRRAEARQVSVLALPAAAAQAPVAGPRLAGEATLRRPRVALAGNPNTGKTTLFNALTGHRGRVGNYPGITVDRLTGRVALPGELDVDMVDVPGTYSLNARSRDEQLAIDEVLGRVGAPAPDVVVVVMSATTLHRGLYLLMQLQELCLPLVGVVNMLDEARQKGLRIDVEGIAAHLGVPVVGVVAATGEGLPTLRRTLAAVLSGRTPPPAAHWHWEPTGDLAAHLDEIAPATAEVLGPDAPLARRRAFALWALMSLAEVDDLAGIPADLRARTLAVRRHMLDHGHDLDLEVTRSRYRHIDEEMDRFIAREPDGAMFGEAARDRTARIDGVLTHPLWGFLVFVAAMTFVFVAIFDWATPAMDGIEWLFGRLGEGVRELLPAGVLTDLLTDGLIAGVGSVVVFLPQILLLFFFITLMEASGYMSRAAFLIDRVMKKVGLNGRAFVPLLSGFACAVPAIMATRTIERRRDRVLTMMVIPLITCSARLPVYTLIIAALFPADQSVLGPISLGALMMLGLYLLSTVLSLVAAAVLGRTILKGKPQPLLLELPPYRLPSLRSVASALWQRTRIFLRTAGTVITVATVILWALLTFPRNETYTRDYAGEIAAAQGAGDEDAVLWLAHHQKAEDLEHSFAGRVGRFLEPAIEPLGFDWTIGIGLLGSFAAREVFVSTMGMVYGVGDADEESATLRDALRRQRHADGRLVYTPLTGASLLVFFMIALQCLSTLAVTRQETGSWAWTAFQFGYLVALAWLASFATYQIGSALGFA
jgi:ferrous iron transport protein B